DAPFLELQQVAVLFGQRPFAQLTLLRLRNWRGPREAAQASHERGRKATAGGHLPTPEGHSVYGESAIGRLGPPTCTIGSDKPGLSSLMSSRPTAPRTSRLSRSGAAMSIASRNACSRVAAEDGHPLQLPCS